MKWFEVDKEGLAKILARRGKQFVVNELVQNAWDEDKVTEVQISIRALRLGRAEVIVTDDSPEGFKDLTHAFTLFAESSKKGDVSKRGRFNLGEKLVLALCDKAIIETTKRTVCFDNHGRREASSNRESGTSFMGIIKMTKSEINQCLVAARNLIPPTHIRTTINGEELKRPPYEGSIGKVALPTEVTDTEGNLRPTERQTEIEIFDPAPYAEEGWLYEMGVPVVATGDRWHINVMQKVPLNIDRDNVTPAYLGRVRAIVAEKMCNQLTREDANSTWVKDAVQRHGGHMSEHLLNNVATLRFGENRVSYDPSDREANSIAASKGFVVVHGSQMSKTEWAAMRRVGALLPAGKVTPSPKPFTPGGDPLQLINEREYTDDQFWFVSYAQALADRLMNVYLKVNLTNDPKWAFDGAYEQGGKLTVNVASVDVSGGLDLINEFLIHEFGHEYSDDHLSDHYHRALCRLGGRLSELALKQPELFKRT